MADEIFVVGKKFKI